MAFSRPRRSGHPQTDTVRDIPVTNTERLCVPYQTPEVRVTTVDIRS